MPAAESVGPTGSVVGVDLAAKKTSHKRHKKHKMISGTTHYYLIGNHFVLFVPFVG